MPGGKGAVSSHIMTSSAKAVVAVNTAVASTAFTGAWGGLQKASEYGIRAYSQLKPSVKGCEVEP